MFISDVDTLLIRQEWSHGKGNDVVAETRTSSAPSREAKSELSHIDAHKEGDKAASPWRSLNYEITVSGRLHTSPRYCLTQ